MILYCVYLEAEKKPMSILELTMSGFEMKSCRNDIVTACSGTVSSAQVLVHSSGKPYMI